MFKEYEYGFYGFHCTHKGLWMDSQYCHTTTSIRLSGKTEHYQVCKRKYNNTMKQLPKIQSVVFIYGNYKEAI